ncbi:MAG: hypothetical protein AVDCRST_MAG76-3264, partial [uncultured Acidimicrobiales bacterium]
GRGRVHGRPLRGGAGPEARGGRRPRHRQRRRRRDVEADV